MARQWNGTCVQCNAAISYAEQLVLRDASVGRPRPAMCPKCLRFEARGLRATAMSQVLLKGEAARGGPLGQIEKPGARHVLDERPSGFIRDKFGVQDEEIQALYNALLREDTPVVIAVAPTGSGKSTFVPFRLLAPEGLPLETFTRGRQIVITQPRRDATIGITGYVAETLHGGDVGIGHEVGYRVRGDHACDWRNRMVYVTDGTLINWIVRGELDRISMIIIDEAHERSLNIDVILGLLANMLPQFPHLKLLIVSATINHEKFRRFFDSQLPASLRCGVIECSGSKPVGLDMHWRDGALGALPYAKGPLKELGGDVWQHLADAIVRIVVEMDSPRRSGRRQLAQGDVLGFLHGAKAIQDACDRIESRLNSEYPRLGRNTDVYPLYAAVSKPTREKAIHPKQDPSRRRIVIASNAAETSLTIDSLVHVVESGFIKQTQWDPIQEQAPLLPIAHSQAGCRQRWGRVGRTMQGFAWSLYTKEQFERIFPSDTVPEIQRSCLDGVVLLAKRGGADRLEGRVFPWLDAPADDEIASTIKRLTRQGALDKDGDLTAAGVDAAFSGGEDALYARCVADADRFGFGIEVATMLPLLKAGLGDLFPDDRDWEPEKRRAMRAAQSRLRDSCADDLELCLRVYQDWASLRELPRSATWNVPAVSKQLRRLVRGKEKGAAELEQKLGNARTEGQAHDIIKAHVGKHAAFRTWIERVMGSLRCAIRNEWARRNGIDASMLDDVAHARADMIRQLGAKKKDLEDRDIDFAGLDRLRIIIARAFPQQVYVRSAKHETPGRDEPRYEPVYPERPDAPLLGLSFSSCCRSQPPQALIAIGPKRQIATGNSQIGERQLILAPFVVGIDQEVLSATGELSDLGLADYFRQHLPRPAKGSAEDRLQQIHATLRREYPPGMLVECRVQSVLDDEIEVAVVRTVGWGGKRLGRVGMSGDRRERADDSRERDFDFRYAGNDKGRRKARVQSLDENCSFDEEPVEEEIQADDALPSGQQRRQNTSPPPPATVSGRLRQLSSREPLKSGDVVVAEVTRHADLRAAPGLVLVTPGARERFRNFAGRYKPGDNVAVQVLGPAPKASPVEGLLVREPATGLETVIPAEDLVIFSENALLSAIPVGSVFSVRVESIDTHQEEVALTNLARLEKQLRKLQDETTYPGTVVQVDHDDRHVYVYVVLNQSALEEGLVVPVKVVMYRELFVQNNALRLPYRPGSKVHVRLRRSTEATSRTRVTDISDSESALLERSHVSVEEGRLGMGSPMDFQTRQRLLRGASSPVLEAAVRELFLASNAPYGERVVTDLQRRFPVGTFAEGTVTRVGGDGIKLALKGGVVGYVALDEISWWDERPLAKAFAAVGDVVKTRVLHVDATRQLVYLSMRRVIDDPWEGGIINMYPSTKVVEGIVRNTISAGAFVNLEPGLDGMIHISKMRGFHGGHVARVTDVVQVGDRVKVRVIEHKLAQKQLSLILVDRLGKVRDERVPEQPPEMSAGGPVSWDDGPWPWTAGENAIRARKKPRPPKRPQPPQRTPLAKRPRPAVWSLSWR